MKDLKFEQKRSLSRFEAADQLTALAAVLREGGDADLDLGPGTLSLRVPDDLRSEIEVEVGDGQIELEIELKWPTASAETETSSADGGTEKTTRQKSVPAKSRRGSTGTDRSKSAKGAAAKTS